MKTLARSILICALLAGCGGAQQSVDTVAEESLPPPTGITTTTGTQEVVLSAPTLSLFSVARQYVIDPTQTNVVYKFDASAGAIDFSRIALRNPDGSLTPLSDYVTQAKSQGYDLANVAGNVFTAQPHVTTASTGGTGGVRVRVCITFCLPLVGCITICISCCGGSLQ